VCPAGVEDLLWRHHSSHSKSTNSAMPPLDVSAFAAASTRARS
jgi:hypothetical protein